MRPELTEQALNQLFVEARSHNGWSDAPVEDSKIQQLYELFKWGPTGANSQSGRFVWVKSEAAKARLLPLVDEANRAKVQQAPVTVIIAYDLDFPTHMPEVFPHNPGAKDWWPDPVLRQRDAALNSSLQGAYLMMAARAIGLDVGPLGGFDRAAIDREFFAGTAYHSNFLCSLGVGNGERLFGRLPRFAFDQVNQIL